MQNIHVESSLIKIHGQGFKDISFFSICCQDFFVQYDEMSFS